MVLAACLLSFHWESVHVGKEVLLLPTLWISVFRKELLDI